MWMLIGFELFRCLGEKFDCIEVFPNAIAQATRRTGPRMILDALMSAWVASLLPSERIAHSNGGADTIWSVVPQPPTIPVNGWRLTEPASAQSLERLIFKGSEGKMTANSILAFPGNSSSCWLASPSQDPAMSDASGGVSKASGRMWGRVIVEALWWAWLTTRVGVAVPSLAAFVVAVFIMAGAFVRPTTQLFGSPPAKNDLRATMLLRSIAGSAVRLGLYAVCVIVMMRFWSPSPLPIRMPAFNPTAQLILSASVAFALTPVARWGFRGPSRAMLVQEISGVGTIAALIAAVSLSEWFARDPDMATPGLVAILAAIMHTLYGLVVRHATKGNNASR